MEKSMVLKPGLLVSLKSSIKGGVAYTRKDLEGTEGAKLERWETTKIVDDPEELERATKVRGRCRSLITSICTNTQFGLICAVADEADLDQAILDSRASAEAFNETAKTIHVDVFVLRGRIAESDNEATRAIASEMKGILDEIKQGIADCNANDIRHAANRARAIGKMLDEETGKKVTEAIAQARAAAREIVKQVSAGADKTTVVLDTIKMELIDTARYAFLDLEESATEGEAMPSISPKDLDEPGEPEALAASDAPTSPSFEL